MIDFKNGPAAGVTLTLLRAPVYLRVVQDLAGRWDALDQLEDEPRPGQRIHVYRREGAAQPVHVCNRDRRRGPVSGWYWIAVYRHVPDAPTDLLRDTAAWRSWAERQPGPIPPPSERGTDVQPYPEEPAATGDPSAADE